MSIESLKKVFSGITTSGDTYVTQEVRTSLTIGIQSFRSGKTVSVAMIESAGGTVLSVEWLIEEHRRQGENALFVSADDAVQAIHLVVAGLDLDD